MTGQVNGGVSILVIAVVVVIAGFFIYRASQPQYGGGGIPANVHPPQAYMEAHKDALQDQNK